MSREKLPYKIVAAFDTETTNYNDGVNVSAFPILAQMGVYNGETLAEINPGNVETIVDVRMCRHVEDSFAWFDELATDANGYVPVVMVHNLGFDMFAFSGYFIAKNVRVLAKSGMRPISFTVCDEDGNAQLVIWDTMGFAQKSLETMGRECGYLKLVGNWDYELVRTPDTPLTDDELDYAAHDIYTLFAWMGYFCRNNPLVDESELAFRAVTKTGVVRVKRERLFAEIPVPGTRRTVGDYWRMVANTQLPVDDDELRTMHAVTRGGFTFTASRWAGVPFELDDELCVAGFDASSQHPAQMTSHFFPIDFKKQRTDVLNMDLEIVANIDREKLLGNWCNPFPVAFAALVRVNRLRLKRGSVYERDGIATLASARIGNRRFDDDMNEAGAVFNEENRAMGYRDSAESPVIAFGKIESASTCELFVTELEWWVINQVYDYDNAEAIYGYDTARFQRPTDYAVMSTMYFFNAKNVFKQFMRNRVANDAVRAIAPAYLVDAMVNGTAEEAQEKAYYQILKSDLNALYGIEITNEARPEQELDDCEGIRTLDGKGIDDLPNRPKTWYQFGQRIVGWSRIAQICAIESVAPHVIAIINGDTDSVKTLCRRDKLPDIANALRKMADSIADARRIVCSRVQRNYPDYFNGLDGIGGYELEFTAQLYYSAWNKSYCIGDGTPKFTVAGLPTSTTEHHPHSYDATGAAMMRAGSTFSEMCDTLLGYNVTVDSSITRLNGRRVPGWNTRFVGEITDCNGVTSLVNEPAVIALYPESKILGSTMTADNSRNYRRASANNPNVNVAPRLVLWPDDLSEPVVMEV